MNIKFFSNKKEFDLKSLNPTSFDVSKSWFWLLFALALILIIGVVISAKVFLTIYMKDYKLKTEEVVVEQINLQELKRLVNQRENFINEEITIPKDPS